MWLCGERGQRTRCGHPSGLAGDSPVTALSLAAATLHNPQITRKASGERGGDGGRGWNALLHPAVRALCGLDYCSLVHPERAGRVPCAAAPLGVVWAARAGRRP